MAIIYKNLKEWFLVSTLAFSAFIMGTAEFTPVGLLPEISEAINRTEADTGVLLTYYAWAVAILSLPLTLFFSKMDRKKLIVIVLIVFCIGNFLVGFSGTFNQILLARIIVAAAHAIYWSIVAPMAARVAPENKGPQAVALISAGSSLSGVFGIPFCTFIGHKMGWHSVFFIISAFGVISVLILTYMLPNLPSQSNGRGQGLAKLLKNKALMNAYLAVVLFVTGSFLTYTYIVPFLNKVTFLEEDEVVTMLFVFGLAGLFGVLVATRLVAKNMISLILYGLITLAFCLFNLRLFGDNVIAITFLLIIWSISGGLIYPSLANWIMKLAPKDRDVAMSIYSALFNVGIGAGAFLGGITIKKLGVNNIGFVGGAMVLLGVYFVVLYVFKRKHKQMWKIFLK
ncbi:MAG: MFS transporter [Alphaproteobacteria bacterium]|nr:MFS transporter [Alphaproteobacteria bacterium]